MPSESLDAPCWTDEDQEDTLSSDPYNDRCVCGHTAALHAAGGACRWMHCLCGSFRSQNAR